LFPILGGGSGNLLFQAAVLALPILACFIIVRDAMRTAEFALTYFGVLLFVQLWQFPGAPRHYGILFVAFVGTVWMWRSSLPPRRAAPSLWVVLLVIAAVGGLTTLAWEFRPFSQSRNAATWIETMHLEDKFLMARLTGPRRRSQAICSGPSIISTANASAPTWCGTSRGQTSSKETRWSAAPSKP
jgi:hypothetical protein